MPFTFSHPALILPLYAAGRRVFSLTGLVIGSIVPDFEYFIRMEKGETNFSHNLPSLFYFNLPLGLVLAFLFHNVIKRPLLQNLPGWLSLRLLKNTEVQWTPYFKSRWPVIGVCILIGALSHFAWDWLTHISGDYFYHNQRSIFAFDSWRHHSEIYMLTHLAHSLLGLAVLAAVYFRLPKESQGGKRTPNLSFWVLIIFITGLISGLRILFKTSLHIRGVVVIVMAAFFLALLFTSLIFNKRKVSG